MQRISIHSKEKIEAIASFREYEPSGTLGPGLEKKDGEHFLSVLAYLPRALKARVEIDPENIYDMTLVDSRGFWKVEIPGQQNIQDYRIVFDDSAGYKQKVHDPYAFPPFLSDYDLHLFSEGTHRRVYDKLGAHVRKVGNVTGVNFAVWARIYKRRDV